MRIAFKRSWARIQMLGLLAVLFALGCGETVEPQDVAGTYRATEWTLSGAAEIDVLDEGGAIEVELQADRSTGGIMIVPEAASDRGQYAVDLVGTWVITSGRIRFNQTTQTFIGNLVWEIDDGRLSADGLFAGTEIAVVLSQVD